ncbi:peptidoglycan recognition protein family protein [Leucobacter sp. HY1908]
MTFSPLADMSRRIPDMGRWNARQDDVAGVLWHHNAGVDSYGQATAPGREVSAHYWIANDGTLLPQIPEELRAWTSGHPAYPAGALADHRFITVEVSNSGGAPGWPISDAALDTLARLIGDVHARYGLGPVKRGTEAGVAVHSDFVATECPGPYAMAHIGEVIAAAEKYRTGAASVPARDKDKPVDYITLDTNARKTKQTLKPSLPRFLELTDAGSTAIAGKPGDHQLVAEVTLRGEPGTVVGLECRRYIWDGKKYTSDVYINGEDVTIGAHGWVAAVFPIANRVPADGSRLGVKAKPLGKLPVTVERYAVKGHRWDRS